MFILLASDTGNLDPGDLVLHGVLVLLFVFVCMDSFFVSLREAHTSS